MTPTDTDFSFVLRRRQFPIRPAFCITINKGQGQSMQNVGIFLPSPEAIFSHGQLYVALTEQCPKHFEDFMVRIRAKN